MPSTQTVIRVFEYQANCLYIRTFVLNRLPKYHRCLMHAMLLCSMALPMSQVQAQVPAKTTPPDSVASMGYIPSYWHNGVALVSQPFHWGKEQWIAAGGSLVFAGSMILLDEAVNQPMANWQGPFARGLGRFGNVAGGIPVQAGISTAAILAGQLAHSKPLLHFGLDNLQAQAFTGIATLLVKNLSHRARPFTGEGAFAWYGPLQYWGNNDYESFFSGHTALSFCTANMLFLHSGKKWWVGTLAFGGATAVGISRMQQQKHWSSDVVLGAIMGTAISSFVYKQQQKRRAAKKPVLKLAS